MFSFFTLLGGFAIEASQDEYDPHVYLQKVMAKDNIDFNLMFNEFKEKYWL